MTRGKDQFWRNGEEFVNVGGAWICDRCNLEKPPNHHMFEPFDNGQHICENCMIEYIAAYSGVYHPDYPQIARVGDHVITISYSPDDKRDHIPKSVRENLLKNASCAYCGSTEDLQIDHIIPVSKNGNSSPDNLQVLCANCNRNKSNKLESDFIDGTKSK